MTCLEHFTTEIIIEGVVKCISSIKPDIHLNHRLPPNLPAQYKLCIDIARACKVIVESFFSLFEQLKLPPHFKNTIINIQIQIYRILESNMI